MSYKRTLRGVDYLIENELDFAAEEHGATFASMHEGDSVIREECEEAGLEFNQVDKHYRLMWECIKENDCRNARRYADEIASHAERLACEAIQVAAMALKFVDTVEEGEDGRKEK